MYVAWSKPTEIESWLDRADTREPATRMARYRDVLASARALGYSVGVVIDGHAEAVAPVEGEPARLDLDPNEAYSVSYIAATAFDQNGAPALVINLDGFRAPLVPDAITAIAAHREKPFFTGLVDFITSAPLVALALEGPNAIAVVRAINGATRPHEASPGTIPAIRARDRAEIVHASDGPEAAGRGARAVVRGRRSCSTTSGTSIAGSRARGVGGHSGPPRGRSGSGG